VRYCTPTRIVAIAVCVPSLAGCNDLLRLSDFERVSCNATCPSDSSAGATAGDGSVDGGVSEFDAAPFDGAVAATDGAWARWPMPNPEGGPDADWPNVVTYTKLDGGVYVPMTNLEWSTQSFAATSIEQAAGDCKAIGFRLPTRIELVSLIDFTRQNPAIHPIFTNVTGGAYWTSSPSAKIDGGFWQVSFDDGRVTEAAPTSKNVICVRSR
jgi:hypothetical protein